MERVNIDIEKSNKEEKMFLINECQSAYLHNEQAKQNNINLVYVITGVYITAIAICISLNTLLSGYLAVLIGFIQIQKLNQFFKSDKEIKKKQENILKQKISIIKKTFKLK